MLCGLNMAIMSLGHIMHLGPIYIEYMDIPQYLDQPMLFSDIYGNVSTFGGCRYIILSIQYKYI